MKEIPLTQGKVAIVDDEDFERLNRFKWGALKNRHGYRAVRQVGPKKKRMSIYMHQDISGNISGLVIDHIDGDSLNNQSANLRWATVAENCRNSRKFVKSSSKYKGVTYHVTNKYWQSRIVVNRKAIFLGNFKDEELAAQAYRDAAHKYHGEFARY